MMKRFIKEVREDTHKVSVTENNGWEKYEYKDSELICNEEETNFDEIIWGL